MGTLNHLYEEGRFQHEKGLMMTGAKHPRANGWYRRGESHEEPPALMLTSLSSTLEQWKKNRKRDGRPWYQNHNEWFIYYNRRIWFCFDGRKHRKHYYHLNEDAMLPPTSQWMDEGPT